MPRSRLALTAFIAMIGILSGRAAGQVGAKAANDLPNPFHLVEGWAKLPAGQEWGQVISVYPDAHGNVWVFHRKEPPIVEFDSSGKFVRSFGSGMFVQPHGL